MSHSQQFYQKLRHQQADEPTQAPAFAIAARMMAFFHVESHGDFWCCALLDGKVKCRSTRHNRYSPGSEKSAYAIRVLHHLNKHAPYGGAWILAWINDGMQFAMVWKDQDGDIQVLTTCDKPWIILQDDWTPEDWENLAHGSYNGYYEWMQEVGIDPAGMARVAQGEHLPSGQRTEEFYGRLGVTDKPQLDESRPIKDIPPEHRDDTVQSGKFISVPNPVAGG